MATRPSQRWDLNISTARRTAASVGLDGVWSNTGGGVSPQAAKALANTPAARTPASVMISGAFMPALAHSAGSKAAAPKSI